MSPLLLLILIILNFTKNKDSYVLESKGNLIQEQKAVQTILPIIAFFFLFCSPATCNRDNRSSNPLAALTMLILIILVFGNDGKLRKGVSGKPSERPYKKPPISKSFTQKQNQTPYHGKESPQHGLNALTILVLILLQYGQGSYHEQDRKPKPKHPVTDDAFSTYNKNKANQDDVAPMEPNNENLLFFYLSILAAVNMNESDAPAKDISVRIIDKKAVIDDFETPIKPQIDVTPLPLQSTCEPDNTNTGILTIPVCDAVTDPAAPLDEEDTESDTDFVDAFIEQEVPSKVEDKPQEEAPLVEDAPMQEQEAEAIIQEINDVLNTTPETEQNLPEVSTEPEFESENNEETETTALVPSNPETIINASEMDTPLASIIKNDYEGSFVTTLLSNLVAAGGEVIFHFNHIISLKLGDKIYFINDKDLLGFY